MLTDEEIKAVIYSDPKRTSRWVTEITPRDRAIAEAQEKDTLKKVREWMENHKLGWHAEANGKILEITSLKNVNELYQSLKRGEMPEAGGGA